MHTSGQASDKVGHIRTRAVTSSEQDVEEQVAAFGADLRKLRIEAGAPPFRTLARTTGYGRTTLNDALRRDRLPTLDVTLGLVRACRGDEAQWRARWVEVRRVLDASRLPLPNGSSDAADEWQAAVPDPEPLGPKRRRRLLPLLLAACLVVAAAVTLAVFHGRSGAPGTKQDDREIRDHCERVREYRVTTSGNVLAGSGDVVGEIAAGDLFKAQRLNGLPHFTHRYYGIVVRTRVWGYVVPTKLDFVADTCL